MRTDPAGTLAGARTPMAVAGRAITMRLGERLVLDAVDLDIEPGTFAALTGPSGAGKSTLLWILGRALEPAGGSVTYSGRLLPDREAAARAGVVLVPQGNALVTPLTARENLLVPLLMLGIPAKEAHARADAALTLVGLGDTGTHLVEELSGGQQQRVAVARGLAARPSILLADEPTSDLDATTREIIVGLLRAEAEAGAAVLMSTHDSWCADQADVEYHLDDGHVERRR